MIPMKQLSFLAFWAGMLSIPTSILLWFGGTYFIESSALTAIADTDIRKALLLAHSERWALFIGLWSPNLLILSTILDKKS